MSSGAKWGISHFLLFCLQLQPDATEKRTKKGNRKKGTKKGTKKGKDGNLPICSFIHWSSWLETFRKKYSGIFWVITKVINLLIIDFTEKRDWKAFSSIRNTFRMETSEEELDYIQVSSL